MYPRFLTLALLVSLIAFEQPANAKSIPSHDGCPGIYAALRASCQRAWNAERWHYLAPDSVHTADWATERRWRGYLKAELQRCPNHRGTPWALRQGKPWRAVSEAHVSPRMGRQQ